MKKTLITLVLMAGIASSASVSYTEFGTLGLDSDLKAAYDFSQSGANVGSLDFTNGSAFTVKNGVAKFTDGQTSDPYSTSVTIGAETTGDFSISLDLITLGANDSWDCLLALYSSTATGAGYSSSLVLHINSSNELVWSSSNGGESSFAGNSAVELCTGIFANSETDGAQNQTITLVQDSTAKTLTLYVNGEQTAQATNWTSSQVKSLNFGAILGGGKEISNTEIDNLAVWNTALSSTGVATLIVPEPATASLSLLGLAALMIRRRRA